MVLGAWRHAVGAGRDNGVALIAGAPALKIERRHQVGLDRVQPVRVDAATSEHGIDELIRRIGNEDEILVEQGLQPQPDAVMNPDRIEMHADVAHARLGGGDTFDLPQHALGVVAERAREQLPFIVERNFVGAARRSEHRHHDADDRERHDDADRHHDAGANVTPTELFAPFADF